MFKMLHFLAMWPLLCAIHSVSVDVAQVAGVGADAKAGLQLQQVVCEATVWVPVQTMKTPCTRKAQCMQESAALE